MEANVYGRILAKWMMQVSEGEVSREQAGFSKGKGCVQLVSITMIAEKYLGKDKKLYYYDVFKDMQKMHDSVDKEAIWDVPNIQGIG